MLPPDLATLLAAIAADGAAHDAAEPAHARRRLNLDPATAELLALLARSAGATRALEVGTSNGYSTAWLAWAVGPAGRVTSVDRDAGRQVEARANLSRAGLLGRVDLITGEATEVVAGLAGPFDLVFFDADRVTAAVQLGLLLPNLAARAVLVADNALSHPAEVADYLAAVASLPGVAHAVVPVGKGLSVAVRTAP